MTTVNPPITRRARTLVRAGQALCLLGVAWRGAVLLPLCLSRAEMSLLAHRLAPAAPLPLPAGSWAAMDLVLMVDLVISSWVLLEMFGLFGALGRNDLAGRGVERRLLRLASAAAVGTFISIVFNAMLALALSVTAVVVGPIHWGLLLSQDNLLKGLGTIFLYLFALIVREMRRLDDENRSFV